MASALQHDTRGKGSRRDTATSIDGGGVVLDSRAGHGTVQYKYRGHPTQRIISFSISPRPGVLEGESRVGVGVGGYPV